MGTERALVAMGTGHAGAGVLDVGGVGAKGQGKCSNLFTVSAGTKSTLFVSAVESNRLWTSGNVIDGFCETNIATTPATWGLAMLVPVSSTSTSESLLMPREMILSPGARMSTHLPKFEPPRKKSD